MQIISTTETLIEYLQQPFSMMQEDSCEQDIAKRVTYAALATLLPFTCALDHILLLSALAGHVATLGRYPACYETYTKLTPALAFPGLPYIMALRVLNPSADLKIDTNWSLSDQVRNKTLHFQNSFFNNSPRIVQQIGRRVVLITGYSLLAVARVADFAIGFFAGCASFVYLGKNETLNNLAYEGLCVLQVVDDAVEFGGALLNPLL